MAQPHKSRAIVHPKGHFITKLIILLFVEALKWCDISFDQIWQILYQFG